jgi:GH24 family phage-related lysozyme (muramidase)
MPRWFYVVAGFLLLGAVVGGVAVYQISRRGIDRIKKHEAFRAEPYRDQAGHMTIGWGHKILPNETYTRITTEQGERLLQIDLAMAEEVINRKVAVPISQNQYDALVSFAYNVGAQAFADSTLLKKLNARDYAGAADELLRWKYVTQGGNKVVSSGLLARRNDERELFVA